MDKQELKREIGLFQATMMVVGVVIGSGVFFKPSSVFGGTMAPGLGLLAWIVGGIIAMAGALSMAELASAMPETGGLMIYLNKLFGEKLGFLFGWTQVLIYFPAMDAALAVAFASQYTSFFNAGPAEQKIISIEEIINSPTVVSDAAEILLGSFGSKFIAFGILVSIFGCLAPFLLTGARLPYSMARDNKFIFKRFFAKLNKNGTPANAILIQIILAVCYIITGTFDTLTNLLVFVTWMFIFLGIIGVFVLRKKHKDLLKEGTYRVPLFPTVPVIGAAGALYICINTFINTTGYAIYGLIVTLVGLPVYMFIKRASNNRTCEESSK